MASVPAIRASLQNLDGPHDLDPLIRRAGHARFVLIGEASHGTHEYYEWRAAITRRLIAEHGFSFVAVEGDGPDHRAVDASVNGTTATDPGTILDKLRGWPSWPWANAETVEFCDWLRAHITATGRRVGWYGLDAHPLHAATRTIADYLTAHEPSYVDTMLDATDEPLVPESHLDAVTALLAQIHDTPETSRPEPHAKPRHPAEDDDQDEPDPEVAAAGLHALRDAKPRTDGGLYDILDAKLRAGAEGFYRAMLAGGSFAWNTRAAHMVAVMEDIAEAHGPDSKGVVWAHNTHIGDARGTDMAERGRHNLGEHLNQRHGETDVYSIGFAGGDGEVMAAPHRGEPMRVMPMLPPRPESLEAVLASSGAARALALLDTADWANTWRDQRAIGVTYDRDDEDGHWIPTLAARRYDALCWFATTTAVRALHLNEARRGELPTLR